MRVAATMLLVLLLVACAEPPPATTLAPIVVGTSPRSGPPADTLRARARYAEGRDALTSLRARLATRHAKARSDSARQAVLADARAALLDAFDTLIEPAWRGTPWDFSGTSPTPGYGEIACGHFVATAVQHLGFDVNRIRLGQLASEHILRTFVAAGDVMRFSNKPADTVIARVRAAGDGLYVLGLDYHAALLRVRGERVDMCHSGPADGVICEPAASAALFESKYRVTGRLFDDDMLRAWLAGTTFVPFVPE